MIFIITLLLVHEYRAFDTKIAFLYVYENDRKLIGESK